METEQGKPAIDRLTSWFDNKNRFRTIRLDNNQLFTKAKLNQDTDAYFKALMDAAPQQNIQLGSNGYSDVSRVMVVFFKSLLGKGIAPFTGHADLYGHVLSFLLPHPYAKNPNHPLARLSVMDYYIESKPVITPWLTERFIKALLTESDLPLLKQASDYLKINPLPTKPYQWCIDLFLFLRELQERVCLSNPKWERTFNHALEVMKSQIIQALDNQNTTDNPSAKQKLNTAYRAAIAMSQRHLKVGVDTRASENALKTLKLLPEPTPKYVHSEACFFPSTPVNTNSTRSPSVLPDFTTRGV